MSQILAVEFCCAVLDLALTRSDRTGKRGGTGAAGEMGIGGGGEGAVGDEGGEGGGGRGASCRGIEARSTLARLEDRKSWTACCKALASAGAVSRRAIN